MTAEQQHTAGTGKSWPRSLSPFVLAVSIFSILNGRKHREMMKESNDRRQQS